MQVNLTLSEAEKQTLQEACKRDEFFITTTEQVGGVTITHKPRKMSVTGLATFLLRERIQQLQ